MIARVIFSFAFLAIVIAPVVPAEAQRVRLYTVKDVRVNPDQRKIVINMSDMRGAVRALRIRTPSEPLLLTNFRIVYTDGTVADDVRRINLLAGERTRATDVSSEDRFVERIELVVDRRTADVPSVRVQVLARQTRRGRRLRRPSEAGSEQTPVASVRQPAPATRQVQERARPSGTILDSERDELETGRGEVLFGVQRVGLGLDRDVVRVSSNVGKFQRFRLRVLENDVFVNSVSVVYRDGSTDTVAVNAEILRNTTSGWFRISETKFVSEVRLDYRARANFRGRARVELFGEFAPRWLGANGEGRKFNDGWVLLGAQTAGFVGFDDDTVPVGRNKGGFAQVRVSVRDRAITLNELEIVYGDGTSDTVPVKARVNAGSSWGPVDLKGDRRPIREIRARYRSRFFDREAAGKGAAVVEVWGRY